MVNAYQKAVLDATDDLLYEAVKTCGLNNVRAPNGDQSPVDPEKQIRKLQAVTAHAAT